jgi:flagellin
MGLRINTNIAAINAHRNIEITDINLSRSMERLSTGYRINRAKDDAAGLAQAQALRSQNLSMIVASRNVTQANTLLQTAEGGADQIHNMLVRLKELATQAASQNSSSNLADIQNEATSIVNEIQRIANSTKYLGEALLTGYGVKSVQSGEKVFSLTNAYGIDVSGAAQGTYLVSGTHSALIMWNSADTSISQTVNLTTGAQTVNFTTFGIKFSTTQSLDTAGMQKNLSNLGEGIVVTGSDATFQIGQTNGSYFRISFQIDNLQYNALGSNLTIQNISLSTVANAQSSMNAIDIAIDQVSNARAEIGAIQNRLDYTYANLQVSIENISAAESVIRDVDMATEVVTFTKNQILLQAGTAMLAQANMAPQSVLTLLGGR